MVKTHAMAATVVVFIPSEVTRNDDAKGWSMSFYGNTLRIENHRRKGFNADFQAEELEEGLLPALLNPFKRRFGMYRNLLN